MSAVQLPHAPAAQALVPARHVPVQTKFPLPGGFSTQPLPPE